MKCPKCGYISFDYHETCSKCGKGLEAEREKMNLPDYEPRPPLYLGRTVGGAEGVGTEAAPAAGGGESMVFPEQDIRLDLDETEDLDIQMTSLETPADLGEVDSSELEISFDEEPEIGLDAAEPDVAPFDSGEWRKQGLSETDGLPEVILEDEEQADLEFSFEDDTWDEEATAEDPAMEADPDLEGSLDILEEDLTQELDLEIEPESPAPLQDESEIQPNDLALEPDTEDSIDELEIELEDLQLDIEKEETAEEPEIELADFEPGVEPEGSKEETDIDLDELELELELSDEDAKGP